jgi:L-asparaginase
VVFAGEVFQGRQAVKVHTTAPKAFAVPHAAPLGQVAEGGVRFGAPARRPACLSPDDLQASIALVPMVVGDEGRMLDLARPHHDGVVIAAFGSGNLPPAAVPAIRRWLADGKPVVLASRCQYGQVTPMYAFEGGGATLVREGVLPAGPRTPSQARMELAIALSAGVRYAHGEAA